MCETPPNSDNQSKVKNLERNTIYLKVYIRYFSRTFYNSIQLNSFQNEPILRRPFRWFRSFRGFS